MKRLLSLTMIAVMTGLAIISCKDDFNEEDFLRLQSELKLKEDEVMRQRFDSASEEAVKEYIAALNEAGDLLAVSLVVRENGNALPGVTVTLSSGTPQEASAGGRANAVTTGTTDASGTVVFDRVTIGAGTATFSKTGYVTATATYDFGTPPAPTAIQVANQNGGTITKYVPPVKQFESAAVPMISATLSEGSTATISGKVTIENDLTNLTPEVPSGLVLRANLTSLLAGTQTFFTSYVLADNNTLGRATIAADGTYTMVVPAAAAGTTINFIIPNIEGTCRMAVNGYDNGTGTAVALPSPEYRSVPTGWGPGTTTSGTIPFVAGARVVVPAAPASGSGLSFNLTPVPTSLATGDINSNTENNVGNSGTFYRIASRGSFSLPISTPTVTVNGGTFPATANAFLQLSVPSITIVSSGGGYDALVGLELWATQQAGNDILLTSTAGPGGSGDFFTSGNKIQQLDLTAINGNNGGFGADDLPIPLSSNVIYTGFYLKVINGGAGPITDAVLTPNFVVDLARINIATGGSGFTSAPSFTFSAGNPVIQVLDFPLFWDITPVMSAGTDYAVIPSFNIVVPQTYSQPGSTSSSVNTFNPNGTADQANQTLQSQLTISAGDIVKKYPGRTLRTMTRSSSQPTILTDFTNLFPQNAKFTFTLFSFDQTTGAITGVPVIDNAGNGYGSQLTGQIVPTIAGAPGSGATIKFSYNGADYNSNTMEWQFVNQMSITSQGSGYLVNLNQRGSQNQSLPASQVVQPGKTYTVNFDYGSGQRRAQVN
jgi:hypothetical protein